MVYVTKKMCWNVHLRENEVNDQWVTEKDLKENCGNSNNLSAAWVRRAQTHTNGIFSKVPSDLGFTLSLGLDFCMKMMEYWENSSMSKLIPKKFPLIFLQTFTFSLCLDFSMKMAHKKTEWDVPVIMPISFEGTPCRLEERISTFHIIPRYEEKSPEISRDCYPSIENPATHQYSLHLR